MKQNSRVRLALSLGAALSLLLAASRLDAAVIGGSGTGDITFHSSLFADGVISPTNTTGTVGIPGTLVHEVFAPSSVEHSYMGMGWNFSSTEPRVYIPAPTSSFTTTKLELVPTPPVSSHHSATMTGSFEVLYTLDAAGLSVIVPGQKYQVFSYVSTLPASPAGAKFDAHWDFTDVDAGLIVGTQDINFTAPVGLNVLTNVASLPVSITVPAGHTTLKVSGFFKLTADSDDKLGSPPPFDTLIAILPEPSSYVLVGLGIVGLLIASRRRGFSKSGHATA